VGAEVGEVGAVAGEVGAALGALVGEVGAEVGALVGHAERGMFAGRSVALVMVTTRAAVADPASHPTNCTVALLER
jgi:hypothetical protein